ncbi:restriction endonuclease subunit S [Pseudotabrizicola algicola]|uniref:Restriction endonuclease subunit S n=1 Tax=Pseudotabrizicola algicola TaxID=2709381 RepID=A0A6B3RTG6_9RHOB|nr:restriction endonuclease subunit S [Pseudotabrizicola algicola]NEX48693.1 restriction endonuclease subunit S [Pseudotabrizicola algicola]
MFEGHARRSIGALCDFFNGNGFRPPDWRPSGLPIIRIQNLNGSQNFNYFDGEPKPKWIVEPGDLLFAWAGVKGVSFGPTIWPGPRGVLNQHIFRIVPKKGVDKYWLYLALQVATRRIESNAHGFKSSLVHVQKDDITNQVVDLPPLPEQRKIAEILRTWEEAIEKLQALRAANLKRRIWMRTHLFTGRTRLPGYSGDWREVTLGEVLTEHGLRGTGAEEVFSVSVHKGLVNQIEHLGRSFAAAETSHYNRVLPGDIVYTKSPTGDFPLGIIKQSKISEQVIVSPLYGVFSPATRALGAILDALFESPLAVRNYLHPLVQKGAKNTIAITNRRFLEGKLRLPMDHAEQSALVEMVEVSQAEFTAIEAKIEALSRQKRGLMQKLLTGEWRVSP